MASIQPIFKNPEEGAKLIEATSKFSLSLYREIAQATNGNVLFSPMSISIALAMTYLGARGHTQQQMKKGMSLEAVSESELHQTFSDLRKSLQAKDGSYKLEVANRLFGQKTYQFLQEYIEATRTHYEAELAPVDFVNEKSKTVKLVNDWVEENTNHKVKDLISESMVNDMTRLILVNAIYFKGNWEKKFDERLTKEDDFYVNSNEAVKVALMYMSKAKVLYGESDRLNCQVIALPYINGDLSMFVMLPCQNDGLKSLKELEDKLKLDDIINMEKEFHMRQNEVNLWLPKFIFEGKVDLNSHLANLGIKDLFSERDADLSGIDGTKQLVVSKVIHKAFIEVNEEGTEAAAATAVVMMLECAMVRETEFKANHPFVFFIRENESKSILFFGRFVKP